MTTSDIEAHIRDIYVIEASDTTVSRRITDKILPAAEEWQKRPLENIYAVMFMDTMDKYDSYKDIKELMKDLKAVYGAVDEQTALDSLDALPTSGTENTPKSHSHGVRIGQISAHISSSRSRFGG